MFGCFPARNLVFSLLFAASVLAGCGDSSGGSDMGLPTNILSGASGTGVAPNAMAGASAAGTSGVPVAGVSGGGTGASGTGAAGVGVAGVGAAGAGVAGTGAAGASVVAGAGAGTTVVAGTGAAGTGAAGTGGTTTCSITADASLSTAIGTVGIVTWSTDLAGVDNAYIEFGLSDTGPTMTAPVDLNEPNYRTLLLGMKQQREYVFRIVAEQGGNACTSDEYTLMSGSLPGAPNISQQVLMAGSQSQGFIISSVGVAGFGGIGGGGGSPAYIFDTDGDVVWLASAPSSCSRAHMSYDGKLMWMLELNVDNGGGEMRWVSMDGLESQNNVPGLSNTHHDFTVLPDGSVAAASWLGGGMNPDNELIERAPDGTIKTIVPSFLLLYLSASGYHPNAIHYYESDDSYTISDRNPNLFVKVSRQGQLLWQFGGLSPLGNYFPGSWSVNHGHHMLDNGNFLFFNNGAGFGAGASTALEFSLNEATWTASEVWRHPISQGSGTLGDVQRLPNGNTLITSSNSGVMEEVTPSGQVAQRFSNSSFGYADFRESLYGPPPR